MRRATRSTQHYVVVKRNPKTRQSADVALIYGRENVETVVRVEKRMLTAEEVDDGCYVVLKEISRVAAERGVRAAKKKRSAGKSKQRRNANQQ